MLLRAKSPARLSLKPQDPRRSCVVCRARFFDCARDALYEKPCRIGRALLLQAQRPRVAARAFEPRGSFPIRVIATTH
jgi:hypothetical protein